MHLQRFAGVHPSLVDALSICEDGMQDCVSNRTSYNALILGLFACLYCLYIHLSHCKERLESSNNPHPLMMPWNVLLQDRRATTCRGRRSPSNFHPGVRVAIFIPRVARLFTDSGCLDSLQATEGGPGRHVYLGGRLATTCPVAVDHYAFGTWRPFFATRHRTLLGRPLLL